MTTFAFSQVDVFAPGPKPGNPVAVVHGGDELTTEQMQSFANWTNLSETTFLLTPANPAADYRLRIFTPASELPFAGHPTLGSAHAWLTAGGTPHDADELIQECAAGLIAVRRTDDQLAFAAPPLVRSGDVEPEIVAQAVRSLRVAGDRVLGANWVDNGPGWLGIRLASAQDVLDLRPDFPAMAPLNVAVIGAYAGGPVDFEVRTFAPGLDVNEDPVTGSANAGLAQWLTRNGLARPSYIVQQGTVLGRGGLLSIATDGDGVIWVGGTARTVVAGSVDIR